jgi:hypothetical protein
LEEEREYSSCMEEERVLLFRYGGGKIDSLHLEEERVYSSDTEEVTVYFTPQIWMKI